MRGSLGQIRHDWTSHLFQAKLILTMTTKIYHRVNFERDMARVVWPLKHGIGLSQMSFSGKDKKIKSCRSTVIDIGAKLKVQDSWDIAEPPSARGFRLTGHESGNRDGSASSQLVRVA